MMAKRCIKIPLETLGGIYGPNLFLSDRHQFGETVFLLDIFFSFFSLSFPISLLSFLPLYPSFPPLCFFLSFLSFSLPLFPSSSFFISSSSQLGHRMSGCCLTTKINSLDNIRFLPVFALLYCLHISSIEGEGRLSFFQIDFLL